MGQKLARRCLRRRRLALADRGPTGASAPGRGRDARPRRSPSRPRHGGLLDLAAARDDPLDQLEPADLWRSLYRDGRPVQYSYLEGPLALWDVQSAYAGPPVAVEPPSAGLLTSWRVLAALRQRGVIIEAVTHAAGLSSTGDGAIDAALPLPERFTIPARAALAIAEARRRRGARIVALGTSVVRAVEGMAARHRGAVEADAGVTDLVGPGHALSRRWPHGMHAWMSHYDMLQFAPGTCSIARTGGRPSGLRGHEFGDVDAILPSRGASAGTPDTNAPRRRGAPTASLQGVRGRDRRGPGGRWSTLAQPRGAYSYPAG
jgi:hypothetical protein